MSAFAGRAGTNQLGNVGLLPALLIRSLGFGDGRLNTPERTFGLALKETGPWSLREAEGDVAISGGRSLDRDEIASPGTPAPWRAPTDQVRELKGVAMTGLLLFHAPAAAPTPPRSTTRS